MEVARFEQSRRVGELAAATGLTVRTLHYYEEIGLLTPSQRTHAGHRLYDSADLARLYQICLLRRLGLPLAEIGRALDDPSWNLHSALAAHLSHLDRQLEGSVSSAADSRHCSVPRRSTPPQSEVNYLSSWKE
ncbi:MAG TPA: MerR family transcriptional regulator [Micromonosporaceae bacterium]|jgi:DNA-binding transcriptional MerR regulator|nr:MerR family transcriptional regulator [Micromonosporaceae bacterium]